VWTVRATKKAIADWFGVAPEHLPEFGPSFNIAPQTFQPVVRLSPESGEREIVLMQWGLSIAWHEEAIFEATNSASSGGFASLTW